MVRWRSGQLVAFAVTASLVIHAALLTAIGAAIAARPTGRVFQTQTIALMLPRELELGLERPSQTSDTWLGHAEQEEHLAQPSEVEQASFSDDQPGEAAPPQPRTEPLEPKPSTPRATIDVTAVIDNLRAFTELLTRPAPPEPEARLDEDQSESEPSVAPLQPTHSSASAQKESPATSIIDVPPDQWKLGKPLAAHGLELKPRRPALTILTMLTAAPANPLCEIKFDREGVPKSAAIIESSGDRRIDDAILASLYRWRASGQELQHLVNEQTVSITIRILLTRRSVA